MNRRGALIAIVGAFGLITYKSSGVSMLNDGLKNLFDKPSSEKMPVLFIGHGSPMNAIEENAYTRSLDSMGRRLPKPSAILVVSAHWITNGTFVTEMSAPKTIHDFYGFPKALFDVRYSAPGSPEIAKLVRETITVQKLGADGETWGLDHGTWAVLRHMYPEADIPVLQLSIDMSKPADYHIQIGKELSKLRSKGVLILGSGNLVHNLRHIRWEPNAKPYDWAIEFNSWVKGAIETRNFNSVLNDFHKTEAGRLSVPTLDHYLPLHYILSASSSSDELKFEFEDLPNGSISMLSLSLS